MKINSINIINNIPLKSNKIAADVIKSNINNNGSDSFKSEKSSENNKKITLFQKIKNFVKSKACAISAVVLSILGIGLVYNKTQEPKRFTEKVLKESETVKDECEQYIRDGYAIGENSYKIYYNSLDLIDAGAEDNFSPYVTFDDTFISFEFNNMGEPTVMKECDEQGNLINKTIMTKDPRSKKYVPEIVYEHYKNHYDSYTFKDGVLVYYDEGCTEHGVNQTSKRSFTYSKNGSVVLIDINSNFDGKDLKIEKCYDCKNSSNIIYKENYCEDSNADATADKVIEIKDSKIRRYAKNAKLKGGTDIIKASLDAKFEMNGQIIYNKFRK